MKAVKRSHGTRTEELPEQLSGAGSVNQNRITNPDVKKKLKNAMLWTVVDPHW
jgi:hypothetical protein